jgi:MFS family permease
LSSSHSRVFYGWWIVGAAAVGLFFSEPTIAVFSFSVFLQAVSQDFHVGRGMIALAFTFHNLCTASAIPIAGYLIDRFGAKRVVIPATAVVGFVLVLVRWMGPALWQYYVFYILLGILGPASGPLPYSAIVSRWFDRHRGLALGLMSFGTGLAAIIYPPVAQYLIGHSGWRAAYSTFGVGILVVPLLVLPVFLKEDPHREGLLPDGADSKVALRPAQPSVEGLAWREIWPSGTFWLIIVAFFLGGGSVHACILHLAPLLGDRGFSPEAAAKAVSVIGVAMLLGRGCSGYFLDRFFAPRVCAILFAQAAAGIAILAAGASGAWAIAAAFMVAMAFGAEVEVIAFLASRYFGLRSFGVAYGCGLSSFVLAGALGTYIMGAGFDRTHSYTSPLIVVFFAMALAAVLIARLGPYRFAPGSSPKLAVVTPAAEGAR